MSSVTAIIITFNEAHNIERCIRSLHGFADEIIVIDSYSTDQTEEICKKHKVTFIQNKWPGINAQRNFSLKFAAHEYIFSIDADEALSVELRSSLIIKKEAAFNYDGYIFNRLTNYCGKWIKYCGWYPDKKLRLFKKSLGKYAGTDPHDEIVLQKGSSIQEVNLDILHYSFINLNHHLKKIEFFSEVGAQEAFRRGKSSSTLKVMLSAAFVFFKKYFLQLGFLDGYYGFIISVNSSYAAFLKYAKLKFLNERRKNSIKPY